MTSWPAAGVPAPTRRPRLGDRLQQIAYYAVGAAFAAALLVSLALSTASEHAGPGPVAPVGTSASAALASSAVTHLLPARALRATNASAARQSAVPGSIGRRAGTITSAQVSRSALRSLRATRSVSPLMAKTASSTPAPRTR